MVVIRSTCSFVGVGVGVGALGGARDAGGADPVAVGDGGQPLDVAAEHPADRLGLGLAQLGELVGDVGDRAVLLAELLARPGTSRTDAAYPSSVNTWARTSAGSSSGCSRRRRRRSAASMNATRRVGELPDGVVAAGLGQEAQRLRGEVVVLLVEAVAAGLGQREDLGRAAAARGVPWLRGSRASTTPSSSSWSRWRRTAAGVRSSRSASAGRGGRAVVEDRPGDALARRLVVRPGGGLGEFHNTSVPLMLGPVQVRRPLTRDGA